jgi:hypothetical protein
MPILRKNGKKFYFAHIPKTAGSSLYLWFIQNDWQISNLGQARGPLNATGVGKTIRERYGIFHLQQEGDYSGVTTSPHHVTADIWKKWGPFDGSFAILREPIARFRSALSFQYTSILRHDKRQHSAKLLENFRSCALNQLENELSAQPHLFDNHFRPQRAFVVEDTNLYFFDENWVEQIAGDFALQGDIGHDKRAPMKIELNDREPSFANAQYADNIAWYKDLKAG